SFDETDRGRQAVAIVNRQFAQRYWRGEDPVGKRVRLFRLPWGDDATPWLTVVGMVSDIVQSDRTRQTMEPLVYLPHTNWPVGPFVLLRTNGAPARLAAEVADTIDRLNPGLPVPVLWSLDERLRRAQIFERNVAILAVVHASV